MQIAEVDLWQSVIAQALSDASRMNREAIDWLKGDSGRFQRVCLMANMHPDVVKNMARIVLERGKRINTDAVFKSFQKNGTSKKL